jgi:hypothetical protein
MAWRSCAAIHYLSSGSRMRNWPNRVIAFDSATHIVAQRLGHAQISMTLELYAHALPNAQHAVAIAAARGVGRQLSGSNPIATIRRETRQNETIWRSPKLADFPVKRDDTARYVNRMNKNPDTRI